MRGLRERLVAAAAILPEVYPRKFETFAQLVQGKGWGAADLESEVQSCIALLTRGPLDRPLVAVDVGANVGEWTRSLLASCPNAEVFAFEPTSTAYSQLQSRFKELPTVRALNVAVGAEPGIAKLQGDLTRTEHVSAIRCEGTSRDQATVDMVALDLFPDLEALSAVDIIKIDTEGGEWDVLSGATRLIARTRVIQFEFGEMTFLRRVTFRDFWDGFNDWGFSLWRQTPRGLKRIVEYEVRLETYSCTNYFARNELMTDQ